MIMDHIEPSTGYYLEADPVIKLEHMEDNFECETKKFFYILANAQAPTTTFFTLGNN